MQKFVVTIILVLFFLSGKSQVQKFSEVPSEFIKELSGFFAESSTRYKEGKSLMEDFRKAWELKMIDSVYLTKIIETTHLLTARRAKNFPHVYDYVLLAFELTQNKQYISNWDKFHEGLHFIIGQKKISLGTISDYCQNTYSLIYDRIIFKSGAIVWQVSDPEFQFLFDSTISIRFTKTDLCCHVGNDSIKIHETSGLLYPISKIWKGSKGKVYWTMAKLEPEIVYAELNQYKIDITRPHYKADSVTFTHLGYFNFPMFGQIQDKVMNYTANQVPVYPKFVSYNQRYSIEKIFEGINYIGGFTMQGEKFIGSGNETQDAVLNIFRKVEVTRDNEIFIEDRLFMTCRSKYYAFREKNITGKNASVSIYLDNDSIYHPGLLFRYFDDTRLVNLVRDNDPETLSKSKYFDSFHKIDMDFELLSWKTNETNVFLTMLKGSTINNAVFSSENYFNYNDFMRVQVLDDLHPYARVRAFVRNRGNDEFTCEDFSKYLRLSYSESRFMLINLLYQGVIEFDLNTDIGKVKPRLFELLDASVGQRDYDQLNFESKIVAPDHNAILNLKNYDLQIYGVPRIQVSDSQNVVIFPSNQQINLGRNRDFSFGGRVTAGLFTFYGQKFNFVYDSFKLKLTVVDSLKLKVEAGKDNWGRRKVANVTSVIEDLTGEVYIDNPTNKSGVKRFPNYPVFESRKPSYVYYDKSSIFRNVYPRATFYFKIDPYTIDSLNSFSIVGLGYKGTLKSASIFPDFEQTLKLQDDYSLGLKHETPKNGYPTYIERNKENGMGRYFNNIYLSNEGFKGDGSLTYLNSETSSKEFFFFPDSTTAITQKYSITQLTQGSRTPSVDAKENRIYWNPKADFMLASKIKIPLDMYDSRAVMHGTIKHSREGLTGFGRLDHLNAGFSSNYFKFSNQTFTATKSKFELKNPDLTEMAFVLKNVDSKYDFVQRKGEFSAEDKLAMMDFPQNQYKAYGDKVVWYENKQEVGLSTMNYAQSFEEYKHIYLPVAQRGDLPVGSLMISTAKNQDSLNFVAPTSIFDIKTYTLLNQDVKYVHIADAEIVPGDGLITVIKNAKIKTLNKASVTANRTTKYHRFFDAIINIQGRLSYTGSGNYSYTDETGSKQIIDFELIGIDSTVQTFAKAKIIEGDNFTLSPAFKYMGQVRLEAANPYLTFEGTTQIVHQCKIAKPWIKFKSEINPLEIYIPLQDKNLDINNNELYSGIFMNNDSVHIFPAFLSYNRNYADQPVATAGGYLYFDKSSRKYFIAEKEKLKKPEIPGNFLSIHQDVCNLYGEGKIDFGVKTGQVSHLEYGSVNFDIEKNLVDIDAFMLIDFFFPDNCLTMMADSIKNHPKLQAANIGKKLYLNTINQILGTDASTEYLKELRTFGFVKKLPVELDHSIVFSDLKLKWNDKANSYRSEGKIGIASIKGVQINRTVTGFLEITRKRSGNILAFYFELDPKNWYFFHYKRGFMQSISSNPAFNKTIIEIKADDRKLKVEKSQEEYMYFFSSERKKKDFLKQFEAGNSDEPTPDSEDDGETIQDAE